MTSVIELTMAADRAIVDGTCPAGHPDGTGCGCWDGWASAMEDLDGDPCINWSLAPFSRDPRVCDHPRAGHDDDGCHVSGCHCGSYRNDGGDP